MRIVVLALATTVAFATAAWAQNSPVGSEPAGKKSTATESQGGKSATQNTSGTQVGAEHKSREGARVSTRSGRSGVSVRGELGPDVVVHKRTRQHVTVTEDRSPSVTVVKKKKKYAKRKRTHVVAAAPESSTTIVRKRRSSSHVVVDGGRSSTSVKVRAGTRGTDSASTNRGSVTRSTTGSSTSTAPAATGSSGSGTSTGAPAQQNKSN